MTLIRLIILLSLAFLALGACATPFHADVQRFGAPMTITGQTFAVVASDPKQSGGLEFAQYAGLVEQRMVGLGYQYSDSPAVAELIVSMGYDVDGGREKVVSNRSVFFSSFGHGPFSRRGGFHGRHSLHHDFHSLFFYGGSRFSGYGDVHSFTVYATELRLKIDRQSDGERLFEGTAQVLSESNNLTYLVPNLVVAMFTNFPGSSGERVRISVVPEKKKVAPEK